MEKEGDPHTLARGPSVTGSKGLALGMCLASLQGLEGEGDRVPGACGGVWGEICVFQPSGSEVAATAPVGRISGVPDGEGTQDSQLAAHLCHLAHLLHLHDVAEVGEQAFVPQVDESPGANLERKVEAFEAIALDGGLEVIVSFRFPLQGTACLGRNRVSNGFCHRSMAKPIYHGKTHDIWVLPCNGFSHSSMAKPMDIMKRNIHGFCHGPLLHGFCHGAFRRKLPLCFQSAWIFFCIASNCCQVLVFRFRFSFWYGNLKEAKKKFKVSVVDKMSFQELLSLRATKSNNQEQEEPIFFVYHQTDWIRCNISTLVTLCLI